jgi:hypothetical protein
MSSSAAENILTTLNELAGSEGQYSHVDPGLAFERPELAALSELWRKKRETLGKLPARSDFEARELKAVLRNLSIVERVGGPSPRFRYRFYGSELVRLTGERTGWYLDEALPPEFLPRWTLAYEMVLMVGAPLRFVSRFQIPQLSYLDGESFSAPFDNGTDPPDTLMAVMYVKPKEAAQR